MDDVIAGLLELSRETAEQSEELELEDLDYFMEERGQLMLQLRRLDADLPDDPPERSRYQAQIQQLVQYDAVIVRRMAVLKDEAADQMGRMNDSRRQKSAYDHDYAADSYFIDRRK